MNYLCKVLLLFVATTAQAMVIVDDQSVMQVQTAITANMLKHGCGLVSANSAALYFRNPKAYYWGGKLVCYEQRFKFVMREVPGGKTAIAGFGVCYAKPNNIPYTDDRVDAIIFDAFPRPKHL